MKVCPYCAVYAELNLPCPWCEDPDYILTWKDDAPDAVERHDEKIE